MCSALIATLSINFKEVFFARIADKRNLTLEPEFAQSRKVQFQQNFVHLSNFILGEFLRLPELLQGVPGQHGAPLGVLLHGPEAILDRHLLEPAMIRQPLELLGRILEQVLILDDAEVHPVLWECTRGQCYKQKSI